MIRHLACCGQSTAIATGVRYALGPIVVTLDGDGQNDPGDIDRPDRCLSGAVPYQSAGHDYRVTGNGGGIRHGDDGPRESPMLFEAVCCGIKRRIPVAG